MQLIEISNILLILPMHVKGLDGLLTFFNPLIYPLMSLWIT